MPTSARATDWFANSTHLLPLCLRISSGSVAFRHRVPPEESLDFALPFSPACSGSRGACPAPVPRPHPPSGCWSGRARSGPGGDSARERDWRPGRATANLCPITPAHPRGSLPAAASRPNAGVRRRPRRCFHQSAASAALASPSHGGGSGAGPGVAIACGGVIGVGTIQ